MELTKKQTDAILAIVSGAAKAETIHSVEIADRCGSAIGILVTGDDTLTHTEIDPGGEATVIGSRSVTRGDFNTRGPIELTYGLLGRIRSAVSRIENGKADRIVDEIFIGTAIDSGPTVCSISGYDYDNDRDYWKGVE